MPERNARTLYKLLIMTGAVIAAMALVEVVFRWRYEQPWYEQLVSEQMDAAPKIENPHGLREAPWIKEKPPGIFRVLALGDSFTYGWGVDDDAAVFPRLLQRDLNKELKIPGVMEFEVLNGGISGSLTGDWLHLFDIIGSEYDPDVILIVFFLRDGTRTSTMDGFFGPIRDDIVRRSQSSFLYRHWFTYRKLRNWLDRQDVGDRYTQAINSSYFGTPEETAEWSAARKNMLEIVARAKAQSALVGLVVFPILAELDDEYPFEPVCDEIMAFAAQNDIPALDLIDSLRGLHAPDLWVSAFDQHPNETAHAIVSDAIKPFLVNLVRDKASQ